MHRSSHHCSNLEELLANNLGYEIDELRDQISDLIVHPGDDAGLQEKLLITCARLLSIYNHLQNRNKPDPFEINQYKQSELNALADVLQNIQASQRLLERTELPYQSVLDNNGILVCQLGQDGRIKYANQAFYQYYEPDSLSTPNNFFALLGEEGQSTWQQEITALSAENPLFQITQAAQIKDGSLYWHQWNGRGVFDSQGRLTEIQVVGHDITAIKRAEIAAEQHNRELTALHTANQALLTTLNSEALLGQILDAAISAVPSAQKGTLHLIARDTGQLELRASIGYADPRIQKFSYSESSGYVARAVRERRALIYHDTIDDIPNPRRELIPEVSAISSAIVAPLILNERVLGAVCLESPFPSAFTESDLRLLVSIAVTATNAIHNAELHSEVQKLAITDALTGLYNRRGLVELGEREIERSFRFKHPLTAIMLDVDNLKAINDNHGHIVGDLVLRSIANCCEKQLRKVDIIGRYGGDEFVVLLPETHMRVGAMVAERVRQCVEETHIPTDGRLIQMSVSLGIAGLTTEITTLEALINKADIAMYGAKQSGGNRSIPL